MRTQQKTAVPEPGSRALTSHWICQCFDLRLPSPQNLERYISVANKALNLWYFVITAWADLAKFKAQCSWQGYSLASKVFFIFLPVLAFPRAVGSLGYHSPSTCLPAPALESPAGPPGAFIPLCSILTSILLPLGTEKHSEPFQAHRSPEKQGLLVNTPPLPWPLPHICEVICSWKDKWKEGTRDSSPPRSSKCKVWGFTYLLPLPPKYYEGGGSQSVIHRPWESLTFITTLRSCLLLTGEAKTAAVKRQLKSRQWIHVC